MHNNIRILVVVALLSAPLAAAGTEPFVSGGCQLQIPSGWAPVIRRAMGPPGQKAFYVKTLQAPTADLLTQQVTGMGGKVVYDKPNLRLIEVTLSNAGKTNKQFWAITKSTPACGGIATTPAGPQEAQARSIAETISRATQ
jgi:hypothetical protein